MLLYRLVCLLIVVYRMCLNEQILGQGVVEGDLEVFCEEVDRRKCLLCGLLGYRIFLLSNVVLGYYFGTFFNGLKCFLKCGVSKFPTQLVCFQYLGI